MGGLNRNSSAATDDFDANNNNIHSQSLNELSREYETTDRHLINGAMRLLETRFKIAHALRHSPLHNTDWAMLLELFVGSQHSTIYVKQLILISGESSTAAMRRIVRLEEDGLITRHPDHHDRRRVIVQLSDQGFATVRMLLQNIFGSSANNLAG